MIESLEKMQYSPLPFHIVACQAHPALVKWSGVRAVFISLLVN